MAKEGERPEERKRTEEELIRLSNAVEMSTDSIVISDIEAKIIEVNEATLKMYGTDAKGDLIGKNSFDLIAPEERERAFAGMEEALEKGYLKGREYHIVAKDGSRIAVEMSVAVMKDRGGRPIGFVAISRDITEQKRAEEALRESEERYRLLFERNLAGVYRTALDGRVLDCNEAFARILGYHSPEEVLDRRATEFYFDAADREKFIARLREEGALIAFEWRLRRKDGSPVWVLENSSLIEGKESQPASIEGTLVNITERKRAEEKRARVEATLRSLNTAALAVQRALEPEDVFKAVASELKKLGFLATIFLLDKDQRNLRIAHISFSPELIKAAEKLLGLGVNIRFPLDRIPQYFKEVLENRVTVFSQGSERIEGFLPAHLRGLVGKLVEILGLQKGIVAPLVVEGEVIGALAVDSPELTENDVPAVTAFANQVSIAIENARLYEQTDEKLRHRVAELTALNAIAESLTSTLELNEMLESMVMRVAGVMQARICTIRLVEGDELTIGAAVGCKDESARQHRIKIDPRLARIVRDQKPLVIEDLWTAEDIPPSRRMRAMREGVHSFLGVPMISREKTIGILSIYGEEPHRFREEEVRLLSTIANQAAIAIESARLYERVREHAEDLERLVQERTKELETIHAELLQTAKLAALGQLAAGVAHELNNPLGAISGYLELLQEEMELGPRQMEYMERIEKPLQQATKIVRELRSTWTPSEPAWQTVNVNDILEETLTLVGRRLSLHQIEVQKEMVPNLPEIHADPDRLQQVFINLITNARQAMKEGGTLRVVSRESRNGEWLEIILADMGEGIAKEHLNKIFDPFFTTRSPGEGMGLGLSVTHRHIKDHGGAIHVWSEKGRGTVFRVALPPLEAKRCWEILDCDEKERCGAVRENAEYRCWSVMEDVSPCERCEVYSRKALPPLDETLLPERP